MQIEITDPAEIARLRKKLAKFGAELEEGITYYTSDKDAGIYEQLSPGCWLRKNPMTEEESRKVMEIHSRTVGYSGGISSPHKQKKPPQNQT